MKLMYLCSYICDALRHNTLQRGWPCTPVLVKSSGDSMLVVLCLGYPLQIVRVVIQLVTVFVIDVVTLRRPATNKRQRYQAVDVIAAPYF